MERGRRAQATGDVLRSLGPDRSGDPGRPQETVVGFVFIIGLMVRSVAKPRVSNHEAAPSFETAASRPPQDEGGGDAMPMNAEYRGPVSYTHLTLPTNREV